MRATPKPDRSPGRRGERAASSRQTLAVLLPALLLAACGAVPGPDPGSLLEPPLPKKAPTAAKTSPAEPPAQVPSLAPLATQQQVVKAVTVGRRDPFAAVLRPNRLTLPPSPTPVAPKTPVRVAPPAPPAPLQWPMGLEVEGVLQTPGESEAIVRYTPTNDQAAGGPRLGSLRIGDEGSSQADSLLPPGWRVRAIDGEQGVLVLQKGGQSVSRRLW